MKPSFLLLQLGLFVIFLVSANRFALGQDSPKSRNTAITTLKPERESFYQSLAESWAPLLFADGSTQKIEVTDSKGQKHTTEALSPADAIVSPFFDEDQDWSNNPKHILETEKDASGMEKSKFPLKAQLLFSVIETKSHYYIAYTKYNALDLGPGKHGQDSEVIWTVVRKESKKPFGTLEFVVTNAHGFPRIYSPDESFETKLREAQKTAFTQEVMKSNKPALAKTMALLGPEGTYVVDESAAQHHKSGRPEFLKSKEGEDRGLIVFVCKNGHALYKCNTDQWKAGAGKGYIYTCVPVGSEGVTQCYPIRPQEQRLIGYSLINQDKMMLELYPLNESSILASTRIALQARRAKFFEGQQDGNVSAKVADGEVRQRPELPKEIVRGPGDGSAEANLFNDWSMKTPHNLSIPHLLHQLLDPDHKERISDEYIFNPYIEYLEVKSPSSQPRASTTTLNPLPRQCNTRPTRALDLAFLRSVESKP